MKVGTSNAKLAEEIVKYKQYYNIHEALVAILKDDKIGDRRKMQLEELIKLTPEDGRELICLVQETCTG